MDSQRLHSKARLPLFLMLSILIGGAGFWLSFVPGSAFMHWILEPRVDEAMAMVLSIGPMSVFCGLLILLVYDIIYQGKFSWPDVNKPVRQRSYFRLAIVLLLGFAVIVGIMLAAKFFYVGLLHWTIIDEARASAWSDNLQHGANALALLMVQIWLKPWERKY